jgi:hypothetical protein
MMRSISAIGLLSAIFSHSIVRRLKSQMSLIVIGFCTAAHSRLGPLAHRVAASPALLPGTHHPGLLTGHVLQSSCKQLLLPRGKQGLKIHVSAVRFRPQPNPNYDGTYAVA